MHLTLCPYCTSRREDAQAFVEGQLFLLAATSAILDSGNDKELCAMRKETIERVFADAAKKHRKPKFSMLFGAAGRIRTAGLKVLQVERSRIGLTLAIRN